MRDRLESLRVQLGMPKDPQLAELIGISVRSLYNAMKGDASRRTATLIELAEQGVSDRAKILLEKSEPEKRAKILLASAPVTEVGTLAPRKLQALEVRMVKPQWGSEREAPLEERLAKVLEQIESLKRMVQALADEALRRRIEEKEKQT